MSVPLETQPHLVGQSVQQQHRLPPGCVDLVPLHWDAGKSTQAEVVDGAKLAAVPKRKENYSDSHSISTGSPFPGGGHIIVAESGFIGQRKLINSWHI